MKQEEVDRSGMPFPSAVLGRERRMEEGERGQARGLRGEMHAWNGWRAIELATL